MWGDGGALGEGGRAQAHYVAFRPKGSCFSGWQLVQRDREGLGRFAHISGSGIRLR